MRFLLLLLGSMISLASMAQGQKMPPISFKEGSTAFADANRKYTETGSFTKSDTLSDMVIIYSLAKIMEINPELVIELEGHVDAAEEASLAIERAMRVRDELVGRGIDADRMEVSSRGKEVPLLREDQIEGLPTALEQEVARQRNRRVVVRVIRTEEE